jgi:excisionase family DNA binding protein
LRKKLPGLSLSGSAPHRPETDAGGAGSPASREPAGRVISLPLTEDQVGTLQANSYTASLLGSASSATGEAGAPGSNAVVIRIELPTLPPLRLLKVEEVTRMLRVSRSYLNRIIRQGYLRSYRLGPCGRLRRILLEDVLAYLEDSRELPDSEAAPGQEKRSTPCGTTASPA